VRRYKVERSISWLQTCRRLTTRWEYYPDLFEGFVHLACLFHHPQRVLKLPHEVSAKTQSSSNGTPMAKKISRRGNFNMSAAIRDVLKENPKLSAKEVEAEVRKQHPGQKMNSRSLSVVFSSARHQLGITKGKKRSVRRRKPSPRGRVNGIVDMAVLQAARKYVSEVGDVDAALEAVRQLRTLQVGVS
jgi:hypothetical protein